MQFASSTGGHPAIAWVIPDELQDQVANEWRGAIGGTPEPFTYIDICGAADGSAFLRIPSTSPYWDRWSA